HAVCGDCRGSKTRGGRASKIERRAVVIPGSVPNTTESVILVHTFAFLVYVRVDEQADGSYIAICPVAAGFLAVEPNSCDRDGSDDSDRSDRGRSDRGSEIEDPKCRGSANGETAVFPAGRSGLRGHGLGATKRGHRELENVPIPQPPGKRAGELRPLLVADN